MDRYLALLTLLLIGIRTYSQDILIEHNIKLQSHLSDKRDIYPIVNEESGNIALFLLDNDTINARVYSKKFECIDSCRYDRPFGKYKILIGNTITNKQYHLYFTNKRQKEFLIKTIDFSNKTCTEKKIPLKLFKEEYLESICYKNKLYVLSRLITTFTYKLRVFEGDKLKVCIEHNFDDVLRKKSPPDVILDDLYDSPELNVSSNFEKIVDGDPNPLDITSKEKKIYCYNDKLILTFDDDDDKTLAIGIDLQNYTYETKTYMHGEFANGKNRNVLSNSYLYDNKLFQLKVSKSEMCLSIHNFESGQLLKEYHVNSEEDIGFKNSPLIQKENSGKVDRERELEKTKQVLRKLLAGYVGVSVYSNDDKLELTLGGVKEIVSPSFGDMLIAGLVGAVAVPLVSGGRYIAVPNYSAYSYSSYANSRAVYFKSLLNRESLEHIQGELSKNPFDKLMKFSSNIKTPLTTQTIFKVANYYVLGYYIEKEKKYVLRRFD